MDLKLGDDKGHSCQDLWIFCPKALHLDKREIKTFKRTLEIKHAFVLDLVVGEVVDDVRESATVEAVLRVEGMVIGELVIVAVPLEHLGTSAVKDVLVAGVFLLDVLRLDVFVAVLSLGGNVIERFLIESITSI